MSKKDIIIRNVIKGSISDEAGIEAGDILLSINEEKVNDSIEYQYLTCDEKLYIILKKQDGEEYEVEIEKDAYEDIGIEFDDPLLDNAKSCNNKCIFCFVDQLPKGLRKTLYFKDDDSRLSFLQGNFITLTNLSDDDFKRIIKYKISPINVSVHTTNPELRVFMLKNKKASNIMKRLKELTDGGISVNCQIVLCPGINDNMELKKTLNDLFEFYPKISNVAIVPVGVTKYRDNLFAINGYDKKSSIEVINLVEGLQRKFVEESGEAFARLGDEFYIIANKVMPSFEHYGDFDQIEDGIGMVRYFENVVNDDLAYSNFDGKKAKIAFITGEMCSSYINDIKNKIEEKLNINIKLYTIKNNFFGGRVSVAGLVTGRDIIEQVSGVIKENITFIPQNMLKADEDIFLDDITLKELENVLQTKIIKCKYTGDDLIGKIIDEVIKCQNQ